MNYFNRIGFIEISDSSGNIVRYGGGNSESLDFRFTIKKPVYAARMEADIGILGLSEDTINHLTTISDIASAQRENKLIRVYGGYEDTGPMLLFSGYIIYARASKPPEMWINIKASNATFHQEDNLISVEITDEDAESTTGLTFKTVCEKVAEAIGLALIFDATQFADIKIDSFRFVGTRNGIIEKLSSFIPDVYIIDYYDGVLKVIPKKVADNPSPKIVLSSDSGLIDITSVDFVGIEIVRYLDTSIGMMDWFSIDSKIVRKANTGVYRAYEIVYKGHLRGNEWYSIIKAMSLKAIKE